MALPWTEENQDKFIAYITQEIKDAQGERGEKPNTWQDWRLMREAEPKEKTKNYPWPNASNVRVPLTSIITNTAWGKAMQAFKLKQPLLNLSSLDPSNDQLSRQTKTLTKYFYLLMKSPTDMDSSRHLPTLLYEAISMGYCPTKVAWVLDEIMFKDTDDDGLDRDVTITLHDGPMWIPIVLEDFYYRSGYDNVQKTPWVAHEMHFPWHEVKNKSELGYYENVEDIEDWSRSEPQEWIERQENQRGGNLLPNATYDLMEIHSRWDVDDDGRYEDIIVTMHIDSGVILREEYNKIGLRSFDIPGYMIRPFELEWRGTCQMTDHSQRSADMMHNSRNDNVHIAGTRMFKARRGSGIRANEKMYPGKIFLMDNPKEDLDAIQAGEVYPSSLQAENLDFMYGQKNSGMSDVDSGFADQTLRSRDTFGGQQLRSTTSGNLFDSVITGLEGSISRLSLITFFHLVANRERVIQREQEIGRLTDIEIEELNEILQMRVEDIPKKIKFEVDVRDVEQTFEVKRQNTLTIMQIYSMYVEKVMPILQTVYNPQLAPMLPEPLKDTMMRFFVGYSTLMEDSLTFFGKEDTDEYLGDSYKKLDALLDFKQAMSGEADQLAAQLTQLTGRLKDGIREEYQTLDQVEERLLERQGEDPQVKEDRRAYLKDLREQAESLAASGGFKLLMRLFQDQEVFYLRRAVGGGEKELYMAQGAIGMIDALRADLKDILDGGEYEDEV